MKLDDFSVLGTKVRVFNEGGRNYVVKETKVSIPLHPHINEIGELFQKYISSMISAGIPLPNIKESRLKGDGVSFVCEYKGPNIVQHLKSQRPEDFLKNKKLIADVLKIIKLAQDNKIFFDPHIKNFVVEKGKVHYVDFSPPYGPDYFSIRLSKANEREKDVLSKNFEYFGPEFLGYHFAGDLLKLDGEYMKIMPQLYRLMMDSGVVSSSYQEFLDKANMIKDIELARHNEGIFLI